jgi:hypothetical protein
MKDLNRKVFISLFKEACIKCFGFPLTAALSEADCRLFSNELFEHTGLVIGPKSIRNYSQYVLNSNSIQVRKENPSVATLDTLARYVLDAPHTNEVRRQENESHYPYWFQYRSRFSGPRSKQKSPLLKRRNSAIVLLALLIILTGLITIKFLKKGNLNENFTDNYNSVLEDTLRNKGWIIQSVDTLWWNRRNVKSGHLTLYTLRGDNWANSENPAAIRNLSMRRINSACFAAEIHLTNFIPRQNWQQAGILLTEDSTFAGKMLRLSISYNDFFGGYEKPPEIIIQVVGSLEGDRSKPEEIAHISLFSIEPGKESLVEGNLANSILKIEKKGNHFRFLYATGPMESFALKEAVSGAFNIQPRYISLFAIQGWSDQVSIIPAYFDSFGFVTLTCDQ